MIPKLEQLEKIAVDNGFTDRDDIVEMVATIKNTTSNKKMQYKVSHKGTDGMIKLIKSKQEAINILNQATAILPTLNLVLLGSHADSVKIQNVIDFFKNFNTNAMTESDYDTIKDNYNSLLKISDINTDLLNDVQTSMDESTELIKTTNEAITFTGHSDQLQDMVDHLILDILPVLLPSVNAIAITAEEKQIEKLVDDYLTLMKNVDPTNGNTDIDRVVLVTNAQTVITDLGTLLSKPDDYIASYVAGDIATYHTELIDVEKKLRGDLIEKVIAIFNAPVVTIKLPPTPKKGTKITQAKTVYTSKGHFERAVSSALAKQKAYLKTNNKNFLKNPLLIKQTINKGGTYVGLWNAYNRLNVKDPDKENFFDTI